MALKVGEKYGKELESGIWVFKKDPMGNEYMEKRVRIYFNEKKDPQNVPVNTEDVK